MSRYIEYEPLMEQLEREVKLADDWKTAHEIANVVKYAPSIDIVRCGVCKYYKSKAVQPNGKEIVCLTGVKPDDFCSYGSRSEKPNNSKVSEKPTGSERSSE